jgi:hypothetical protein
MCVCVCVVVGGEGGGMSGLRERLQNRLLIHFVVSMAY